MQARRFAVRTQVLEVLMELLFIATILRIGSVSAISSLLMEPNLGDSASRTPTAANWTLV